MQREDMPEEDELLQGKFADSETVQREAAPNRTGLPDNLKSGIEAASGYSMDDVRVHYNSPKPAQLQALAYTQGTDIHVAPGQEKHLPHEAWHVVQQKQGRVQPTMQLQGVNVNDNEGLEREADVMGDYSLQMKKMEAKAEHSKIVQRKDTSYSGTSAMGLTVQRENGDEPALSATTTATTTATTASPSSGIVPLGVPLDKTKHNLGALYYGIHDSRIIGIKNMKICLQQKKATYNAVQCNSKAINQAPAQHVLQQNIIQRKKHDVFCNVEGTYIYGGVENSFNVKKLWLIEHKSHPPIHIDYTPIAKIQLVKQRHIPSGATINITEISTMSKY